MTTLLIMIGAFGALFCGGAAALRAGLNVPLPEPRERQPSLTLRAIR